MLITAAESVPGVEVESVRPHSGRLDTHHELELIEEITGDPEHGLQLLAERVPRIFRAGWALIAVREGDAVLPARRERRRPGDPRRRPAVAAAGAGRSCIDPAVHWVPEPWSALDTELAAAPFGAGRAGAGRRASGRAGVPAVGAGPADPPGRDRDDGAGRPERARWTGRGPGCPAGSAPALRPELAGATDEIIAAVRAEVPDYARPLTGRFGMRITEGVSVALGQFLDLLGRDEPLDDDRVYRALGQLEHREGRTLAALQSAYQVGTRTHVAPARRAARRPASCPRR